MPPSHEQMQVNMHPIISESLRVKAMQTLALVIDKKWCSSYLCLALERQDCESGICQHPRETVCRTSCCAALKQNFCR